MLLTALALVGLDWWLGVRLARQEAGMVLLMAFFGGTALWLLRPLIRWAVLLAVESLGRLWGALRRRRRGAGSGNRPSTPGGGRPSGDTSSDAIPFGITSREFEALCGDVCRAWGYQVQLGSGTGDGGVDVELWRDGVYSIAQSKLYQGSIPIAMVRDFYGTLVHRRAASGFIFTTGRFPRSAHEFVTGKPITLVDGTYLCNILREQRQTRWLRRLNVELICRR